MVNDENFMLIPRTRSLVNKGVEEPTPQKFNVISEENIEEYAKEFETTQIEEEDPKMIRIKYALAKSQLKIAFLKIQN